MDKDYKMNIYEIEDEKGNLYHDYSFAEIVNSLIKQSLDCVVYTTVVDCDFTIEEETEDTLTNLNWEFVGRYKA